MKKIIIILFMFTLSLASIKEEEESKFYHVLTKNANDLLEHFIKLAEGNEKVMEEIKENFKVENWLKNVNSEHPSKDEEPYFPFGFEVDPNCRTKDKYYYRTIDGSCNWLRKGESTIGKVGTPYGRDRPSHFAPGSFDKPRQGPNAREVSNAFFSNKETKYWDHSFFLSAWVEFLIHDLMLSNSGHEKDDIYTIPVPKGDIFFDPNGTGNQYFNFWRTKKVDGTGKENIPRENVNDQTPWIDLSSVYGTDKETNLKIRTLKDGKLILVNGNLPFNSDAFNFNMVGFDKNKCFAAGDPRANQDYALMALHTIFAREHNRLCDILKNQHEDWDDETLFQTARVALSNKMAMIGGQYLMAYYLPKMKFATPLSIFQQWYGESILKMNPLMKYPWKRVLDETGKPSSLPNEFSVGYRWHTLLPDKLPLVNSQNNVYKTVNVPYTAFNATGFLEAGIDDVLRGMAITSIPDFHSGTQDSYRNMKVDFHDPSEVTPGFDLVAYAIEHERERGLPTYNEYMKGYTGKVPIKPRNKFEDFTTNPEFVEELKRLYSTPDDVDLLVGQELDEEFWPNTHIPKSMLIINFYTLFKASVTDRFTLNYNLFWCFLVDKPWNCKTNNALQDLLWKPIPWLGKNAKWLDEFWWNEFDISNQGLNLFRQMITKNTEVKCLQKNPFFLPNDQTNPIICHSLNEVPGPKPNWLGEKSDFSFLWNGIDNIDIYLKYAEQYGDIVHYKLSRGGDYLLVSSAPLMHQVFTSPVFFRRPLKSDWFDYTYGRVAGFKNGTLAKAVTNSEVPHQWEKYIHLTYAKIVPQFSTYIPEINRISRQFINVMASHIGEHKYEPYSDARLYAFNLTGYFNYGPALFANPLRTKELFEASLLWLDSFPYFVIFKLPWSFLLHFKLAALHEALDKWSDFADEQLAQKRADKNFGKDWFGIFASSPINGSYLQDHEVKAIAFETLEANVGPFPTFITYGLYLLGSNPEVQEKIYEEVKNLGPDISLSDLHKLPILQNTVKEILREYPAGGFLNVRVSREEEIVGGYSVPPGTNMALNVWKVGHDPRYWENPEKFNPDRWLHPEVPGSWVPFGDGARGCAGKDFVLIAGSISIAQIIQNFKISYTAPAPPHMTFNLFATFKTPVQIQLEPRSSERLSKSERLPREDL